MPERFWNKVQKTEGCWLWQGSQTTYRYGKFKWQGKKRLAHRVAYVLTSSSPIPAGLFVCHRCDTPLCVNPAHLFLGTPAENVADMMAKGRGVQPKPPQLTALQVSEIRERYTTGQYSYRQLAKLYSCSAGHIRNIVKWKRRQNVQATP